MANQYNRAFMEGSVAVTLPGQQAQRAREDKEREKRLIREAQSNIETKVRTAIKAKVLTVPQFLTISLSLVVALCSMCYFISTRSTLRETRKDIVTLERSIQDYEDENNNLYDVIETSKDYQAIYEYATKILGMHFPEKNQIIYYDGDESEHVVCDDSIPKN